MTVALICLLFFINTDSNEVGNYCCLINYVVNITNNTVIFVLPVIYHIYIIKITKASSYFSNFLFVYLSYDVIVFSIFRYMVDYKNMVKPVVP